MPSRRDVLASGAVIAIAALAGCPGSSGTDTEQHGRNPTETPTTSPTASTHTTTPAREASEPTATPTADGPDTLHVGTSWALYGPLTRAAARWNGNAQPSHDEYDPTLADRIGTNDVGVAGHFARQHGFAATGTAHDPPFRVTVGNAEREQSRNALAANRLDIAGLGSEAYIAVSEETSIPDRFVRHDLFRTGLAVAVSEEVYAAGVETLTPDQLRAVYNGRLTNWASVGGPDRDVHLVTDVNSSPSPPFERTFLGNEPGGGADELYGRERRRVQAVASRDDTLARVPVPDLTALRTGGTDSYRFLQITVDGTPRGPGGPEYPGTYPVPLFTSGAPDGRERAFLDMATADAVLDQVLSPEDGPLSILPASTASPA